MKERKCSVQSLNLGLSLVAATVGMLLRMLRTSDALSTHVPIVGKVFKSATLCFRDEQCREDTSEHESREDLHNMVEPRAGILGCGMATSA